MIHLIYREKIMPVASNRRRQPPAKAKVKNLTVRKEKVPAQIILLLAIEKGLSGLALIFLASSLGFYAWTVYLPKLWSQEYRKLETLQRHERQMIATNESLKHQLAQQAEKPEAGLTNPQPHQSIFIPSNGVETSPALKASGIEKQTPAPMVSEPMGY